MKHTSVPLPQVMYGQVLDRLSDREDQLINDPKEMEVRNIFKQKEADARARVAALPGSWDASKVGREGLSGQRGGGQDGLDQGGRRQQGARRAAHPPRRAVLQRQQGPGQGEGGAQHQAPQLPRPHLLPDAGHRRAAAHPDALLHDPVGDPGAPVGLLVAVLHLPALLHRPGAGRAGQVRHLQLHRGDQVRRLTQLGVGLEPGRSDTAHHHRHQRRRHRAAGGDQAGPGHRRAGHAGHRRACRT